LNSICIVPTSIVQNIDEARTKLNEYLSNGYEGLMLRSTHGKYKQKFRSRDLLKWKLFSDSEFEIVNFTEGTSTETGCIIFVCKADSAGNTFSVRPTGSFDTRREMFKHGNDYIGKMYTVKYQELDENGIPRFPVGIRIRESMD